MLNSVFKDDAKLSKQNNFREVKSDFFDYIISNLPVFYDEETIPIYGIHFLLIFALFH